VWILNEARDDGFFWDAVGPYACQITLSSCLVYFRPQNVIDQIYTAIKDMVMMLGGSRTVKMVDVMERCTAKGFKPDAIDACIDEYEELNVLQVNQKRDKITFL